MVMMMKFKERKNKERMSKERGREQDRQKTKEHKESTGYR